MLKIIAVIAGFVLLGSCAPTFNGYPVIPNSFQSHADLVQGKAECDARAGQYRPTGMLGLFACITPTSDGGKACAKASDCQGVCYADTRQCSKASPLFGCYSYLNAQGEAEEICID